MLCVFYEVGSEFLNIIQITLRLQIVKNIQYTPDYPCGLSTCFFWEYLQPCKLLVTFTHCCQPYFCMPETTQAALDSSFKKFEIGECYKELLKHFSFNSDGTILIMTLHED